MPEGRRKIYANGTVQGGKQIDSRGKVLGIKGKMIDSSALPEWATDRSKVEAYQKAVNDEYTKAGKKAPIDNFGKTEYGRGRFGPQTASILKERGTKGLVGFDSTVKQPTAVSKTTSGKEPTVPPMSGSSSVEVRNTVLPRFRGETVPIESSVKQNGPVDRTLKGNVTPVAPINGSRNKVFNKGSVDDIVPYISNIANSFRRTPLPDAPGYINPIGARRVNYDNQRAEADRSVRGANSNADFSLDENTAAAIKSSGFVGGLRSKNAISEAESNTNAQIGMDVDRTNAGIEGQNVTMGNQWKQNLTEAQIAGQMNSADNLSNAADKYIMQKNEASKMDLDKKRLAVYSGLFKNSGVMDRQRTNYNTELDKYGLEDNVVNPPVAGTSNGRIPLLQGLFGKRTSTALGGTSTIPTTATSSPVVPGETVSGLPRFSNEPVGRTLTGNVEPVDPLLKKRFSSGGRMTKTKTSFHYGNGGFMRTKVYN